MQNKVISPLPAGVLALALAALPPAASARDADGVERKPLSISTQMEMGQIVQGEKDLPNSTDPDGWFMPQLAVGLNQEVVVNRRLQMKIGVGGVFYYSFPLVSANPASQGTKFGPGISQAQAIYKWGDLENPFATVRMGYFPYKYNPDAKNLGEYLFRGGAYPTFVSTGGWSIMDNAFYRAQGITATWALFGGAFKQDFSLHMERDFRPQFDFTPSYLMDLRAGAFQFGAGVAWHHYLPVRPSQLAPKIPRNSVVRFSDAPAHYAVEKDGEFAAGEGDTLWHAAGPLQAFVEDLQFIKDANGVPLAQSDPAVLPRDTFHFTFKAVKLMARASFEIQKLRRFDILGPEDLKVFGEMAVLGVKDYPILYENVLDRMPVMVGVNLPAFKLLDILSVQVEYFRSPFPDEFNGMIEHGSPTYNLASYFLHNPADYRHDDWKWSVYAARELTRGLSLRAQVANDHLRPIASSNNRFTPQPLMGRPSNWYYVFSLNFGI